MDPVSVLLVVLLIAATVLCGVGVWALFDFVSTSRSLRALADDSRQRLVPLLDKADVTVDALNAELLRIDLIVSRFEVVSEQIAQTGETVSGIAGAPERVVEDITARVRDWMARRQEKAAERRAERERPAGEPSEPTDITQAAEAPTQTEDR